MISIACRSKKKKKHDILFPEEVVVKEEPGLEKPREKVWSFCRFLQLYDSISVKVVDAGISIYDDDDLGKREKKERRDRGREGERGRRDDREGGRREERRGR